MRISARDPVFQWWPGPLLRTLYFSKLAEFFMMEARRPGRVFPLLILALLKSASAGSFAPSTDSSITGETYFTLPGSTDSEGTVGLVRRLSTSTEDLTSTDYRDFSTAEGSESESLPGIRERGASTATDEHSFSTELDTESWISHSGPEVSTELLSTATKLSTITVTEWADPSTVANITDGYLALVRTERQSATQTSETENSRTETSETESSRTETGETENSRTETSETETSETETSETETSETETSRSETSETETSETETSETETSETETSRSETSETETGETETSETRTGRDLTVTNLSKKDITEKDVTDTTELASHTDSTYISTTISRAGERTLLSILFNSTSSYTEGSSSFSEVSPLTATSEEWRTETETTKGKNYTEGAWSTEADHTRATIVNHPTTNASQETMPASEPEVPQDSQGTQSQTGQPNITGPSFEATSYGGSSSNSTLPVTVVSSFEGTSEREIETSADSSTSRTSYTDSTASESSITPAMSPEDTHPNTSHHDSETMTTETLTRLVNTEEGQYPKSPQTYMDETTVPGLTTAPPTLTTTDDSLSKFLSGQRPFVPQTNRPANPPAETTEVLTTAPVPVTHKSPHNTEYNTRSEASTVASTTASTIFPTTPLASTITSTSAAPTTHQLQPSTAAKTQTPYVALSTIETTQMLTTSTTEQQPPTTKTPTPHQSPSSSQPGDISTDVSTLHLETSTATPGNTTAHGRLTTVSYSKIAPTRSTPAVTTGKSTDRGFTQVAATATQTTVKSTPDLFCANGGLIVPTSEGHYKCACLPAWTGATCTEDVNECVSNPCPGDSECMNTSGSFSCKCPLGYDLEDGRSCTLAKTFLGKFSVNSSLHLTSTSAVPHDLHKEILQLLNASLSVLHGYRRSILRNGKALDVSNMFSMSANVTSSEVCRNIHTFLRNCSKPNSRCTLKLHYQLTYQVDSLCQSQKNRCDSQSSVCRDEHGTLYCQCKDGFFKKNLEDTTCRDCGDGFKLVNGTCVGCMFGFGGFNCNNFYGLIAKVVSPAAGGLLLIVIIALIVTCCRKDKNDINKIIFKSGELQMSPYAEFPKSSRVSMEWGRETIEMQENGSTKNLLQMTDIYYSPALRNADLERNGLYPFSGLPGSRHSCIYPAQWNPSFISDDSRRRDYF